MIFPTKLQWHPFSISSAPFNPYISFHIKDMAKLSWTRRLGALATDGSFETGLVVNIDGPYGYPPEYLNYEVLILVAGGVGVTPVHSILLDLFKRFTIQDPNSMKLKKVYFYWSVRKNEALDMIRDTLIKIVESNLQESIILKLYVTQPDKPREPRGDKDKPREPRGDKDKPREPRGDKDKPREPREETPRENKEQDKPRENKEQEKPRESKETDNKEREIVKEPEIKEKDKEPEIKEREKDNKEKEKVRDITEVKVVGEQAKKSQIPFNKGRPNMETEFTEIATLHAASIKRHKTLAFVCGPGPLVDSIAWETYKHNITYHSETFEL